VGTQLAFGGSGSAPWEDAAEDVTLLDEIVPTPVSEVGSDAEDSGSDANPQIDESVDRLIDHVIAAIQAQEPRRPSALQPYSPGSVRPSGYTPGGSSVSSGTSKFVGTARAGRSAKLSAARGAAAVAAASALARGDANTLAELGLNLEELQDLSPREQQQAILDEIIGAPGHPDDEALRRAAHATLKEIASNPDLTQDDQIDYLLGAYVYEQALVELTSQHANRQLGRDIITKLERRMKPYIFKKAKHLVTGSSGYLSASQFIDRAAALVETVFAAMKS
jgi:hypothetical protein